MSAIEPYPSAARRDAFCYPTKLVLQAFERRESRLLRTSCSAGVGPGHTGCADLGRRPTELA